MEGIVGLLVCTRRYFSVGANRRQAVAVVVDQSQWRKMGIEEQMLWCGAKRDSGKVKEKRVRGVCGIALVTF